MALLADAGEGSVKIAVGIAAGARARYIVRKDQGDLLRRLGRGRTARKRKRRLVVELALHHGEVRVIAVRVVAVHARRIPGRPGALWCIPRSRHLLVGMGHEGRYVKARGRTRRTRSMTARSVVRTAELNAARTAVLVHQTEGVRTGEGRGTVVGRRHVVAVGTGLALRAVAVIGPLGPRHDRSRRLVVSDKIIRVSRGRTVAHGTISWR